jgi:hypothetical protein
MNTLNRTMPRLLLGAAALFFIGRPAYAWDPPDGVVQSNGTPAADQAIPPATPTTLLPKAHGYIIQNGISILYNDGYWFAAQTLRQWQQELLNGVRYADVYQGTQQVDLEICELFGVNCNNIDSGVDGASWPYAADNHYFNPDTDKGLQAGFCSRPLTGRRTCRLRSSSR